MITTSMIFFLTLSGLGGGQFEPELIQEAQIFLLF